MMELSVRDWVEERLDNSRRLYGLARPGSEDQEGWGEDVLFWEAIAHAFGALDRLLSAIDSGTRKGRCLDHLPRKEVDTARAALLRKLQVRGCTR